jgi:hypothetical protein
MKTIPISFAAAFAGVIFISSAPAAKAANPRVSADVLTLSCQEAGLNVQDRTPMANQVSFTPGPPIKVREGYVIDVFYFNDDTGALVGILEKGPESVETAHIKTICLNKKLHNPPSGVEGEIEITAHFGEPLNIRFHLNKKAGTGYLGRTSWKVPPRDSVGMTGPYKKGQAQDLPTSGVYPSCLDPKLVNVTGKHKEDLSFDFDNCLAPSTDDVIYVYDLYLQRKKDDGTEETYSVDPQIINHGQGNKARH